MNDTIYRNVTGLGTFRRREADSWPPGDREPTITQLRGEHASFIEGYAERYGIPEGEIPSFGAWLECELQDQLAYKGDEDALLRLINGETQ